MTHRPKTGILMLNLGGPDSPEAVRPFLTRLFSDREIIKLPGGAVGQFFIGRMIARSRTKEVQENYAHIGGGSPIVCWSTLQGRGMVERLRARGHDVEFALAMRYWHPTTDEALDALLAAGCTRLLALTMYPHYSIATTGSSMAELRRVMKRRGIALPLDAIESWYEHPAYLDAMAAGVRKALAEVPPGAKPTILVSAHGLPQHFIDDGDPYCDHIKATMAGILSRLPETAPMPKILAYQSRVGPVPWIGPSTEETIDRLAAEGVKELVVIPISFVSDHIETLYEIDQMYGDQAKKRGITTFARAASLNDDPLFLDALAALVEPKLPAPASAPEAAPVSSAASARS
ncbi:MAG TPA: ferrochelatase [Candidatus Eisenbacteria bacterium]|nr:ferrochelatase [Candidatus Eisenbacteria bacterium]